MKAMLLGFVAIAVIAVASNFILKELGFSASETTAGNAVRLGD